MDYDFTAKLEDELDAVARGEQDYVPVLRRFWEPFKKLVDEKSESVTRAEVSNARVIGVHPESGKEMSVRLGRFGPFAQIGTKDDEDKPKFASLRPGQRMDSITFDEALKLFDLPRKLGLDHQNREITIAIGRFGPFAKVGTMFVSLPKEDDPYEVTLERAIEIIKAKEQMLAERVIKTFNDGAIQVLKGKYGPYITDGEKNGKIAKDVDPNELTLEDCIASLAAAPKGKPKSKSASAKGATERAKREVARQRGKTAAAPKKAAAKKAADSKTAKARVKSETAKLLSNDEISAIESKKAPAKKAPAKKAAAKKSAAKKSAAKKAGAKKAAARKSVSAGAKAAVAAS